MFTAHIGFLLLPNELALDVSLYMYHSSKSIVQECMHQTCDRYLYVNKYPMTSTDSIQ